MKELVYMSLAVSLQQKETLDALLKQARTRNESLDVTGALFFDGERFLQILEGPSEHVNRLYHDIETDKRHQGVTLFYEGDIEERAFEKWAMAYKTFELEMSEDQNLWNSLVDTVKGSNRGQSMGIELTRLLQQSFMK